MTVASIAPHPLPAASDPHGDITPWVPDPARAVAAAIADFRDHYHRLAVAYAIMRRAVVVTAEEVLP